jgi:uncharacterized protein (AIM24 family)
VSEPTDQSQGRPSAAAAGTQPRPKTRQVVTFRARDGITGADYEGAGVVVAVGGDGEAVTVRPLAAYTIQVDPANVSPASADDVG